VWFWWKESHVWSCLPNIMMNSLQTAVFSSMAASVDGRFAVPHSTPLSYHTAFGKPTSTVSSWETRPPIFSFTMSSAVSSRGVLRGAKPNFVISLRRLTDFCGYFSKHAVIPAEIRFIAKAIAKSCFSLSNAATALEIRRKWPP